MDTTKLIFVAAIFKKMFVLLVMGLMYVGDAKAAEQQSLSAHPAASNGRNKLVAKKVAEFRERDDVASLEFSPDGAQLAVDTAVELPIHIWSWQTNPRIVSSFSKPHGTGDFLFSADGLRYSPDGKLLAVAHGIARDEDGHGVVRVFNVETGAIVYNIGELRSGGARSRISFTPDGSLFVRTFDRFSQFPGDTLIVHRTDTWEPIWGVRTIPLDIMAMAMSADGKNVAIGGLVIGPGTEPRSHILVVSLDQRKVVQTINDAFPLDNAISELAWSSDGNYVAAGVGSFGDYAGAVRVFDIRTGEKVNEEKPTELGQITGLRYTPDGKYLIESGTRQGIEIRDARHHQLLQKIMGIRSFSNIAISRDGRYFAFGDHKKVQVWQIQ